MRSLPFLLIALAAACQAPARRDPPPLRAPELVSALDHYVGTPLGGVSAAAPADSAGAWGVEFEVLYVESTPEGEFEGLRAHARLVSDERGAEPFETAARLAEGGRVATGSAAQTLRAALAAQAFGRTRELARARGALPDGVTATLALDGQDRLDEAPVEGALRKQLALQIGRTGEELTVALVVEDLVEDASAGAKLLLRESIVLDDAPPLDGAPLAILLPQTFGGGEGRALARPRPRTRVQASEPSGATSTRSVRPSSSARSRLGVPSSVLHTSRSA